MCKRFSVPVIRVADATLYLNAKSLRSGKLALHEDISEECPICASDIILEGHVRGTRDAVVCFCGTIYPVIDQKELNQC